MTDSTNFEWDPLTPAQAAALLRAAPFPWWIAGGHAIEFAVGRGPLRAHDDLDVLVLRRDQLAVRDFFADWDCEVSDPPGTLRPWPPGETLRHGVHDVWCRRAPGEKWQLRLMVDEADDDRWRTRRDARITRPLAEIGRSRDDGVPFLAPEIQLYYKANRPRPKDQFDFDAVLPVLDAGQRAWLARAIATSLGRRHRWLEKLQPAPEKDAGS
ncbi:MAG: hypothetical protein AB7O63_14805 [Reyranellaceae bacterium]